LSGSERAWPPPDAGQFVWCRFPDLSALKPGRKPRPALVLRVFDDEAPVYRVLVAYGTSQRTDKLFAGEFRLDPMDGEAYRLAGLSSATKFNLAENVELPYTDAWFVPPPGYPHGQTPKLGILHSSVYRRVEAAWKVVASLKGPT
jgi:hypothetical protein